MKRLCNRRGSAVIEMPIAMLLLSMLLMFFAGYCYAYYHKAVMGIAAHEGAREYGLHREVTRALDKTVAELRLGGVKDAAVVYDAVNGQVVVTKNIGFYIPMLKRHLFRLVTRADFRSENTLNYYRKGID